MSRLCLYFRREPDQNRWLFGDRFVRPLLRRAIRGVPRPSGVDKVFINLCLGLDRVGVSYQVNLPFAQLRDDDRVSILGVGRYALEGYDRENPIVAGIALMNHPTEWPTLCEEYPITAYLQHSKWANDLYKPHYAARCRVWPVGIDTVAWHPNRTVPKRFDFLIYDKIRWRREELVPALLEPIRSELTRLGFSYVEIRYGGYNERQYRDALNSSRRMIFLCEHESQGIAYQEALASDVPILAWDQGWCLDPNRFAWGQPAIPATSVPYFDDRCGVRFRSIEDFPERLAEFLDADHAGNLAPRDYVLENLTLEICAQNFVHIVQSATDAGVA